MGSLFPNTIHWKSGYWPDDTKITSAAQLLLRLTWTKIWKSKILDGCLLAAGVPSTGRLDPIPCFAPLVFRAKAFLSAQDSGLVEETRCLSLILDLRMPGLDGLELQRNLAGAHQRIPIIFVSARASEDERMQAIAGGAVDSLRKPFSEDALFNAIQAALKR